jgi:hypothetical protein
MASAELSRRVEKVVGYPPLSDLDELQCREFHEARLEAASFEDLPCEAQAAIPQAEQNRPKLRVVVATDAFATVLRPVLGRAVHGGLPRPYR